jgi:hypothetical protein
MTKLTYRSATEERTDKAKLDQFRAVINGAKSSLRLNGDHLWILRGRGDNYISTWGDGQTWLAYLQCHSPQAWTWAKKRLSACGCTITQDGDDEGVIRFMRLPAPSEATEIRTLIGIRQPSSPTAGARFVKRAA